MSDVPAPDGGVVLKIRTTIIAPHHDRGSHCPEVVQAPDGVWHACAHESHKVDGEGQPIKEIDRKQRLLDEVIPGVLAHIANGTQEPVPESSGRTVRKPKTPQDCLCECGTPTRGGRFNPGHDARLRGRLTAAVRNQELRAADRITALERMKELGWGHYVSESARELEQ